MLLTYRNALISDAECLFEWRNDKSTREASYDSDELKYENHLIWLNAILNNTTRDLIIFEENGSPVGTVRIDYANDIAMLSWAVDPTKRGRGIAKQMVSMIVKSLSRRYIVKAEVKATNFASQKVAQHAGLKLEMHKENVYFYNNSFD